MKSIFRYRIRSGALQFVIFIAVLIALILSGLILYAYTFVYLKEQSKATIENIQFSDSGISYLLQNSGRSADTLLLDFSDKENQSVKGHVSQWGIFEKAFVETRHRQKRFVKMAIIGSVINSESPTLYLQETHNPLTVVGDTRIKGNAFLPLQGIRSGYIAGQSYYGNSLIYGTTKPSSEKLPPLDQQCVDQLYFYCKEYKVENADFDVSINRKVTNSFKEVTKSIYSKHRIELENINMTGNIIVKSDSLIVIKSTAVLHDLIVIAPEVEIEDGVAGVFQVLASKRITVGKNCRFNYPSALVLVQDDVQYFLNSNKFDNKIFIDEGTDFRGSICYLRKGRLEDFYPQIVLEKTARIKGQVYCMGNFELKGRVSGIVFTKQFMINMAGSIYMNHLYDGIIENENIPSLYGGILFENQHKTLMKWLY